MQHRERVVVVAAALLYALGECLFGLLLVAATASRGHVPSAWNDILKAVARADVGAFPARWLLNATRGLQRGGKALFGLGVIIDGGVKAGLLVGVLHGSQLATTIATVLFGALAIGALGLAGFNPSIGTFVTTMLNVGLAVVVAFEMRGLMVNRVKVTA
jgi:hypothetical protein